MLRYIPAVAVAFPEFAEALRADGLIAGGWSILFTFMALLFFSS